MSGVAEVNPKYLSEMASSAIPVGYKQTEVGVVPEDWLCEEIGSFKPFITSGSRGWAAYYSKFGSPFVRITNTTRKSIYLDLSDTKYVLLPDDSSEGRRTSLENGDVLISITADIGICSYVDDRLEKPAFINQHIALVRFDSLDIDSKFVAYYLSSENVQKLFRSGSDQGAKAGMNLEGVRKIHFAVPPKAEQTAIANALSDVDALISELEKLIAKKQAIKTATMQQLLTGRTRLPQFALRQDGTPTNSSGTALLNEKGDAGTGGPKGEGQGGLRKSTKPSELGEIPEDWEVVTLGDIGQTVIGLTYSPNDVADFGTLVLRSSNVQNGKLAYADNVYVNMELPERVIVKQGDILICVRNGSRQLIGKCALIDENAEGSAFGAFMSIFRTKYSVFVFYQFQSDLIQNQINEIMGATINQITNKDMSGFKITLPSDEKEQTAIATILSDMDAEIQALEQRLGKTRQIKQGMMQELLTGKTRLIKPSKEVIHE